MSKVRACFPKKRGGRENSSNASRTKGDKKMGYVGFYLSCIGILISLISLIVSANYNRINLYNSRLSDVQKYSIEYLIALNKRDLIFRHESERTLSDKAEEINININNKFAKKTIETSINNKNRFSKQLVSELNKVTKYHDLEKKKMTQSSVIGGMLNSEFSSEEDILKAKEKYSSIENEQKSLSNSEDDFNDVLIKYYNEEKKNNKFKLLFWC
jgi:hypothetical protein